ncbi:Ltp family lipoprotein [Acetitomaculum ruminis]
MDLTAFSRQGLIEQLTSPYGSQFTQEQAEYAVNQLGL